MPMDRVAAFSRNPGSSIAGGVRELRRRMPRAPTYNDFDEITDYQLRDKQAALSHDLGKIDRVYKENVDAGWRAAISSCEYKYRGTVGWYVRFAVAMFIGFLVVHEVYTASISGSENGLIFPGAGPREAASQTFMGVLNDQLDMPARAATFGSTYIMWILWVLYAGLIFRATYAAVLAATDTYTHCTRFSYYNPLMWMVPQGIVHVIVPFIEMEIYYQCLYVLAVGLNYGFDRASGAWSSSPNAAARTEGAWAAVEHLYSGTYDFWFKVSNAFRSHISSNLTHLEDLGDLAHTRSW